MTFKYRSLCWKELPEILRLCHQEYFFSSIVLFCIYVYTKFSSFANSNVFSLILRLNNCCDSIFFLSFTQKFVPHNRITCIYVIFVIISPSLWIFGIVSRVLSYIFLFIVWIWCRKIRGKEFIYQIYFIDI